MTPPEPRFYFPGSDDSNVFARVSAEQAGWTYLNMVGLRLETGKTFGISVDQYEYIAVILGGVCDIRTSRGDFLDVGRRPDVFNGMPYAIYIPRSTEFEIEALSDDFALASCWSPTDQDHPIRLIKPNDVTMEFVDGGASNYQVNTIIAPGFGCHRLTARELYIPGGGWAQVPPHKHDTHSTTANGALLEASLEEICFFKFDRPAGYALNDFHSDGQSSAIRTKHNDLVVVPKGYHSFAVVPGSNAYVLSVTSGSAQSHTYSLDPRLAWVKNTQSGQQPRLPIVDHGME